MIIVYALLNVLVLALLFLIMLCIKCNNAFNNQMKIVNAIDEYSRATGDYETSLIIIGKLESVIKTTFRLWDWGYRNILPYQYYKLIEPYIK